MQDKHDDVFFAHVSERVQPVLQTIGTTSNKREDAEHPQPSLLLLYQKGWLPQELRLDVQRHLVRCSVCRMEFALLHLEHEQSEDEASEVSEVVDRFDDADFSEVLYTHEEDGKPLVEDISLAEPDDFDACTTVKNKHPAPETEVGWLQRNAWLVTASLGVVLLLALPSLWDILPRDNVFHGVKGKLPRWVKGVELTHPDFASRAILHLGVADGVGKTIRRLKRSAISYTHQSLFFGYSLAKPGGYVYLLRIDPKEKVAPELLYPFSMNDSIYAESGKVHIVQQKEVTQRYPLEQERHHVLFVLFQTKVPLLPKQIKLLLKERKGWDKAMKVWERTLLRPLSFSRILVRLRSNSPGEKRR